MSRGWDRGERETSVSPGKRTLTMSLSREPAGGTIFRAATAGAASESAA